LPEKIYRLFNIKRKNIDGHTAALSSTYGRQPKTYHQRHD
jgi:hypothetical protein